MTPLPRGYGHDDLPSVAMGVLRFPGVSRRTSLVSDNGRCKLHCMETMLGG